MSQCFINSELVFSLQVKIMDIETKKQELCSLMKELYAEKILTDIGGNVSFKDPERKSFWISPSRIRKNTVQPGQLVEISLETGDILSNKAGLKPSVEWPMHQTIYKENKATMILHTHAPYATAYSVLEQPPTIPKLTLELTLLVPEIIVVPYAPSGTYELGSKVSTYLEKRSIVILKNHGTVAISMTESFDEPAFATRALEEYLRMYTLAKHMGRELTPFPM